MSDALLKSYSLTAFTPSGTVSRLCSLCDSDKFDRVILLKGGSRRARADMLLSVEAAAKKHSLSPVSVTNADTALPEAVFFNKTALIDAAAPNPIEPKYPTAFEEVLWLGSLYDRLALTDRLNELKGLCHSAQQRGERAQRLLSAADSLLGDSRRMAREAIDEQKLLLQAKKAAKRLSGSGFSEAACLFSGCFSRKSRSISVKRPKTTVALQDETGCCAPLFLRELYKQARSAGSAVIVGYSPFSPYERIEQLIFPEHDIGFFTENSRICCPFEPDRVIHSRRFTDKQRLFGFKNRISLNKKAAEQLIGSAKQIFDEQQTLLAECDAIYDSALDKAAFQATCDKLSAALL